MKYYIALFLGILTAVSTAGYITYQSDQSVSVGADLRTFISTQLAGSPISGYILSTDGTNNVWIQDTGGGGGGAVDSVNGQTGVVVLDADDISDATTTNKFTTQVEIDKLAGIAAGAEVNVNADWNAVSGDAQILNKPTISGSNTGDVTLAGTPDYITISGQTITRNQIDLATDITGDLPFSNLTQLSAHQVLGRAGAGTGDVAGITMGNDTILGRSGSGDVDDLSAAQVRTITETETTTQLNTRDTNNRARTNHTGTQSASTISDFVSNVRTSISETVTGLDYNSGTGVLSTTAGFNIPLTASTTEWTNFYNTPSTRITAGANCSWVGNTFNCTSSGGGGGLSTTSPWTNGNLAFVTGQGTVGSVATGTLTETVSGLEFDQTRGLVGGSAVLSLTSGYTIPLTASTTNWTQNVATSTDNAIGRFDGVSGKFIQNSVVTIDDFGNLDINGGNIIGISGMSLQSLSVSNELQVDEITSYLGGNVNISATTTVPDRVYGPDWNGSNAVPTRNALWDKIESLVTNLATQVSGFLGITNGGTGTSTAPTTDQILVGRSGGAYDYRRITAGTNVTVSTSTAGQIQISATGGGGTSHATSSWTVCSLSTCDFVTDGTADQVQINQALSAASSTGGVVQLFAQSYNLASPILLQGLAVEGDGNPEIQLIGMGREATKLVAASNVNAIEIRNRAKYDIRKLTFNIGGSGTAIKGIAGTERGNWQSNIEDIYIVGNFSSMASTSWGIDLQSPFRMRLANIEMNGVANGANLSSHTDGFNPGNLSIDRMFIDLWDNASNASATALRIAVASSSSTGVNNLVSVNRLDVAGGSNLTNSIGVHILGSISSFGDSRHHSFNNLNIEDIKTVFKMQRARDNTFTDINYTRVLSGGTFIELDSNSHNNFFENAYVVAQGSGQTFNLITDANGSSNLPNSLKRVDGFQPSSVTINATLAANTILEHVDLSGGSPTIDTDITNRNNVRTFAGLNIGSLSGLLLGTSGTVSAITTGSNGNVLSVVAGTPTWVATSTLGLGGSGGVSDGDKGDITVSGGGATWTIDNNAVTFAKMQAITDGVLLGAQGGTAVEEISIGSGLSLTGNTLSAIGGGGGSNWSLVSGGLRTSTTTDFAQAAYFVATSTTATSTFAGAISVGGTGTTTIESTNANQAVRIGDDIGSGIEYIFSTVGDVIVRGYGAVTDWIFRTGVQFLAQVFDNTGSAGTNGQLLSSTGTGVLWVSTSTLGISGGGGGSSFLDFRNKLEMFNDFTAETTNAGDAPWAESITGTGAACTGTQINTNIQGMTRCTTGSTATGRSGFMTFLTALSLGQGTSTFETSMRLTTLSDATNRYSLRVGFQNGTAANQGNAAYLLYDEGGVTTGSAASANWQCVTADNNTRTYTTSATAVSTGSFQDFKIEVNAAGTSVGFYVGGVLICTHTTNIPTGFNRSTGSGVQMLKSVGTTARTYDLDWMYARHEFTTPR